ncbi:hypothetical protein DPMN_072028 [Dreissena polymorpha]|uniref:Short-chain dehydrogenase/reductase 3 n=2 Tax=Dreissena polymorpha TaxID=45954 RepID=A0A9D3Z7U1_DREPO|nr:hypothetical protein DPMN_072028 [Dreissena polymorpha]
MFVPIKKKSFAGKVVLVTGAGHGIGRELALQFSEIGARLVLWDINSANLEKVKNEIQKTGHTAVSYVCDVSKIEDIKAVAKKVRQDVGEVEMLVNNAGILHGGALLSLSEQDIRRTFDVNVLAHFWTCREFLPHMIRQNEGHIVNVASMSAQRAVAYLTDYASSKYAVKGFTQGLRDELRREGHTGIHLTTAYPMFVDTGLAQYAIDRDGMLTPRDVAAAVVDGVQRNEPSVFIPGRYRYTLPIMSWLPSKFLDHPTEFMYKGIHPQYHTNRE